MPRKNTWVGRIYLGRNPDGTQRLYWVGRFDTRRERDLEVAKARTERPWETKPSSAATGNEWADRYLTRYERLVQEGKRKSSSLNSVKITLKAFRETFGDREITSITPVEAEDWAATVKHHSLPPVVALMNYAQRMQVIPANPFVGLSGGRTTGRRHDAPPTLKQLDALRDGCEVHGPYAQQMRDLLDFAALTLLRPGELYELRYPDIDLVSNRIEVKRRVYRGHVDLPKNGKPKTIALVPPAREILMRQPTRTRDDGLVFVSKTGRRIAGTTASRYWALVCAHAHLQFDFYLASRHLGVHNLYKLGLSKRAIAAQAGWSERDVEAMLRIYGHMDLVALAEVDALYAVSESDATSDAGVRDVAS